VFIAFALRFGSDKEQKLHNQLLGCKVKMNRFLKLVSFTLGIVVFLVYLGFGIGSSKTAPEYALVFIDSSQSTYIAPACLAQEKWKLYPHLTIEQAHKLKLNPDPQCVEQGGFVQEDRSLTGVMLEKLGILKPKRTRWNLDGTWNW
jgi:hypothetical protein